MNLQILPQEQAAEIQHQAFSTKPQSIYVADGLHYPISAVVESGNKLSVGETASLNSYVGAPIGGHFRR